MSFTLSAFIFMKASHDAHVFSEYNFLCACLFPPNIATFPPCISLTLAPVACDSHNVMVPKGIGFRIRPLLCFAVELASF